MENIKLFKSGYAAIIGEPNAGKSTLLNSLLQQKLSIVTAKPQTTRHKILGIVNGEQYQIILLDTPGLLQPKYRLHEVMMQFAYSAIADAEVILLLVDAEKAKRNLLDIGSNVLADIQNSGKPVFLVVNKVDLLKKEEVLPVIDSLKELLPFKEVIPLSALKNFNTYELLQSIVEYLPEHPPYYPMDIASDAQEKFFVGEIIREKIFELYHDEIPFSTTVDIVSFKERTKGKFFISADIIVERQSQKGILIGKQGKALKRLGSLSRTAIEEFIGHSVFLDLHVKVREDWRETDTMLKQFGYTTDNT